jgi:hypothetical protein
MGLWYCRGVNRTQSQLLERIYSHPESQVYLRNLVATSSTTSRATFVFGHNPRTSDFTHVGAAEMLAGLGQAAYCITEQHLPELLTERNIARCCFGRVDCKFSSMLAPETEATLDIEIHKDGRSLPRLVFSGFISGSVECAFVGEQESQQAKTTSSGLSKNVTRTLRSFYNNGSELTLKSMESTAERSWYSRSSFSRDARLRWCSYLTTTQIIVGLSQVAFAAVGDVAEQERSGVAFSSEHFRSTMSDQALVRLAYTRHEPQSLDLNLHTTVRSTRNVQGCTFVRLKLDGSLNGTMDNMLSPRVPVKSVRRSEQH